MKWIDDGFELVHSRFGTWVSFSKEGNKLVTSGSETSCLNATRFYLKGLQEGFTGRSQSYDGVVEGKL